MTAVVDPTLLPLDGACSQCPWKEGCPTGDCINGHPNLVQTLPRAINCNRPQGCDQISYCQSQGDCQG